MGGYLILFARSLLGLVMLVSGVAKLRGRREFADFADWLRALALLPDRLVTGTAAAIAAWEGATVVLVAFPATASPGLVMAAVLVLTFAATMIWLARRGVRTSCRCFGAAPGRPLGRAQIVRNFALGLVAGAGAVASAAGGPSPPAAGAVAAAVLGAATALVAIRLDDLLDLLLVSAPAGDAVARTSPTRSTLD